MKNESFIERLNELMTERQLNVFQLSKEIKYHREAITRWLDGKYFPRHYVLIALSDYFNCSIDFLLGRSDNDSFIPAKRPTDFHERFNLCLEANKMTAYRVAKECKIGQSTISEWAKLGKTPETATLISLANLFGCSVDYLLGRADD